MANNSSSDYIFFEHMEAHHVSKYLMMAFAVGAIVVTTPLILAAISFERIGNRLLTDRLVSSNFVTLLVFNFVVQAATLIRYVHGPFSPVICQIDYLFKNILTLKAICTTNFALAVRYIFVMYSKNPTAVQDDYWCVFLECWAVGFAAICQVTTFVLPGKHPMFYYFCEGRMPKDMLGLKTKGNPSFTILVLITIVTHVLSFIHLQIRKYKDKFNKEDHSQNLRTILKGNVEKNRIYSFASQVAGVIALILSGLTPSIINSTDPTWMKEFPFYLFVYSHHLLMNGCGILAILAIFYSKRPKLRSHFKRLLMYWLRQNDNI